MDIWIKRKTNEGVKLDKKNDIRGSYTRFGKIIPEIEMQINVMSYFNCNEERAAFIINQLKSDSKIDCRLSDSAKIVLERFEKEKKSLNKDKFKDEVNKRFENIVNIKSETVNV